MERKDVPRVLQMADASGRLFLKVYGVATLAQNKIFPA
jgi:hypothetical protein